MVARIKRLFSINIFPPIFKFKIKMDMEVTPAKQDMEITSAKQNTEIASAKQDTEIAPAK